MKKSSAAEGEKYLKKNVPPQLWYQVQKYAREEYKV
jgi:hypothetical protein